jgi:hypothetical protein
VTDKRAPFLRFVPLGNHEFADVNDYFESERNEKNDVFLLTLNG